MEIKNVNINELKEYANNPRRNDKAVAKVKQSIKEFGFKVPIIIDKDNVIITGHTRVKAGRELGMETIPAIQAIDLTEEQVKAFRIADNKTNEFADWDEALLELELADIGDLFTGFEDIEKRFGAGAKDVLLEEDLSDQVSSFYQVVVSFDSEQEQYEGFNKLTEEGYQCQVLTL